MIFELPALAYAYNALEPVIDATTVEIHYSKHHATYAKNLNATLENFPQLAAMPITKLLSDLNQIPEEIRTSVRNNGGGYYNHIVYWENLSPTGGGEPKGKLGELLISSFGSFTAFKEQMEKAGLSRFGSGWAWLSKKLDGTLLIHSTANQDTPLSEGLTPLLAVDVWEHAYYLKYQNRRAEYLGNIWNILNWEDVSKKYLSQ
jgi:Fe-Mn family superoxide dismutase